MNKSSGRVGCKYNVKYQNKWLVSIFLLVGLTTPISTSFSKEFNAQRALFEDAEKQVWQPNSQSYLSLYNQLHFYPLQPYLDQRRLMHKTRLSDAPEIKAFLEKYKDTPLDWPLRHHWLNFLIRHKQKALYIENYRHNSDATLNCYYWRFQLDAGLPASVVLPQVTKYWVVGKSQDKACDPLFKQWQAAGYLTQDLVWERLTLAADGGKHTLIPYLTTLLDKDQQYLGNLWHKTRKDPAYVTKLDRFPNKTDREAEIMAYGLKRLIWRDQNRAINAYQQAVKAFSFPEKQLQSIDEKFAVALASKQHSQATQWLGKVANNHTSTTLMQWQLTNALQSNDWKKVNTELASMSSYHQNSSQWQYWYARSLLNTNKKEEGNALMQNLAQKRHYYGFLAASYLKLPKQLEDKPLAFTEQEKQAVLDNPAAKRAFEFYYLGRYTEARKEWNYWLSLLGEKEKLIAASIAYDKKWYDRPIFTLASEGYMDDVSLRFPLAFQKEITEYAQKNAIDPSWAFAIARRESSFMSDASSPVGAKGLMQLMPATAKQLAKRSVSTQYLFEPKNNIKLGTQYLQDLLKSNKGNHILATASYNAGPHRISQWVKKNNQLPVDIWIETIPFKETREYVKSVLAYQEIYQVHLGVDKPSKFDNLSTITISQ